MIRNQYSYLTAHVQDTKRMHLKQRHHNQNTTES